MGLYAREGFEPAVPDFQALTTAPETAHSFLCSNDELGLYV